MISSLLFFLGLLILFEALDKGKVTNCLLFYMKGTLMKFSVNLLEYTTTFWIKGLEEEAFWKNLTHKQTGEG